MSGGFLFQPSLFQPFAQAFGAGLSSPRALPGPDLKSFGAATRTAWSIGIEWFDYAKQAQELAVSAAGRLAGARSPAEMLSVQASYLREAGGLAAARMPAFLDLSLRLVNDLARMPAHLPDGRFG